MSELPQGFFCSGIHASIKKNKLKDLALIYSSTPAVACGVFTKNTVKAAPVIYSEKIIKSNRIHAVIINSGCANACTGENGIKDIKIICSKLAKALSIPEESTLMASTGVIGERLPVKNILHHIPELLSKLSSSGLKDAARAILTTDKYPKIISKRVKLNSGEIIITGFAKGAGMIQPNMATMLAFILTDAVISKNLLRESLKNAVDLSFNRITVDGDMSTNDTVLILANGASGIRIENRQGIKKFNDALTEICRTLAEMIVSDGEGATHVVKIEVKGAKTLAEAKKIAYSVGNSPLVKTAIYGRDPNWGRIMASIGATGLKFNPAGVDIYFDSVQVVKKGVSAKNDEKARIIMGNKKYTIRIDLNSGQRSFFIFTTDLTYGYVKINASYKS
jgi:glutamate N-acetyltransferase/amino-acid N-acetyltransferase